ncbi:MAG: carbon-nitrogen hydrolase family protein, partial [bacterium]
MDKIRVGLIQHPITKKIDEETELIINLLKEATKQDAQLICLAEFSFRPWFLHLLPATGKLIPPLPEFLYPQLKHISAAHDCYIHMVDVEEQDGEVYNSAQLICPDGNLLRYYKRHVPNLPGFREKAWYMA